MSTQEAVPYSSSKVRAWPRLFSVVVVAVATFAFPNVGAVGGSLPVSASQIAYESGVRQLLGLQADASYVAGLVERGQRLDRTVEVFQGIAMTHGEAAEMKARIELQNDAHLIAEYGARNVDSYAGMYIDQHAGGVAVALFTKDVDANRKALTRSFPMPQRLRVESARWTAAQLQNAAELITKNSSSLGSSLESVGIDPVHNVVTAYLSKLTSEAANFVLQSFPAGLVDIALGQSSHTTAQISGGTGLTDVNTGGGCTFGFSYRSWNGGYGLITAGHCGLGGDTIQSKLYPSQKYTAWGSDFPGDTTDSMVVPTPYADTTNTAGWIVVTGAAGIYDDPVGTFVCDYGSVTGTQRCGTISQIPYSTYEMGRRSGYIYWPRIVQMGGCNMAPVPGDSGGPVYSSDNRAYGLITGYGGSCNDQLFYTNITYALNHWNITIPR